MRRDIPFEVVCEIEPATRPSLTSVREQVRVLAPVSNAILIPDNHLGRATVSSIAASHEVALMGAHPIACINSRDRNRLGFRRDLLTAAAYGVTDLLFVFGDRPEGGRPTNDLTVAKMIEDARSFSAPSPELTPFVIGVTTRLSPIPTWKSEADVLFVQASFDRARLFSWRDTIDFSGPIYAGVLVLASASMARSIAAATSEIDVPAELIDQLERDPLAGVDTAIEQIASIEESRAFDGVHLIPVGRFRQIASRMATRQRPRSRQATDGPGATTDGKVRAPEVSDVR